MSLMNHDVGRQCLLEVAYILDDIRLLYNIKMPYELPYFLMQGTALGAYRDKGFVPTERDIDIGILQEHLQPIAPTLLAIMLSKGFDVECFTMPFNRPRTIVGFKQYRSDIDGKMYVAKVDIVGMTRWKDKRFTATPVRSYIDQPYCLVHDAEILENTIHITLFGRSFYIPSNIEVYLEREYGTDWRTPTDDHVSRTREYNYIEVEGISTNYLERYDR
jgi:hypothetical protein